MQPDNIEIVDTEKTGGIPSSYFVAVPAIFVLY
jgi:hypothetical protein